MRTLLALVVFTLGGCVATVPIDLEPQRAPQPQPIPDPTPEIPPPNWTTQASGTAAALYGIWGSSAREVYVAGDLGVILRSTDYGTSWSTLHSGSSDTLFGVFGVQDAVYAFGYRGTLLRSTDHGDTWVQAAGLGTSSTLFSMGGTAGDLYVGGEAGLLLHSTDGVNWATLQQFASGPIYAIWSTPAETMVASDEGVFRSRDAGASWQTIGVMQIFNGAYRGGRTLWSPGSANLFVGLGNDVYRTRDGGINWETLTNTQSTGRCSGLFGFADGDLWAVLDDGQILHYGDGFTNLTNAYVDKAPSALHGIWGSASTDLYVVGDFGLIQHHN